MCFFSTLSVVINMPPKKSRKRTHRTNITEQTTDSVMNELVVRPATSESNIRAGTSGGYAESRPPQQGSSQDSSVYAPNAATIACLPSTSQPASSAVYTHSDPLSGLSWSFDAPPPPVSSGQFSLSKTFKTFVAELTF